LDNGYFDQLGAKFLVILENAIEGCSLLYDGKTNIAYRKKTSFSCIYTFFFVPLHPQRYLQSLLHNG
jgi:hypothetical protein